MGGGAGKSVMAMRKIRTVKTVVKRDLFTDIFLSKPSQHCESVRLTRFGSVDSVWKTWSKRQNATQFPTPMSPYKTLPIALASLPAQLLRLPPKAAPKAASNPTIKKLLSSFNASAPSALPPPTEGSTGKAVDAMDEVRGLGKSLPTNLRIEEFQPKRAEYEGVNQFHRKLVRSPFLRFD